MAANVKLLAARRAYEFAPDEIRLTLLSTQIAQTLIRDRFGFAVAAIATPMPTFGPVTGTLPPGVIFNTGSYKTETGDLVPIRYLHFEATRIVIDIAGPSASIDNIYGELRKILDEFGRPNNSAVLGEPTRILDQTEVTWRPDFRLEALLREELLAVFREFGTPSAGSAIQPGIQAIWANEMETFQGANTSPDQFTLQLRAGSRPVDRILFSAAPLSTDRHLAYVERLDEALSP